MVVFEETIHVMLHNIIILDEFVLILPLLMF